MFFMNLRIGFVLTAVWSSLSIASGNTIFYAGDTQSNSLATSNTIPVNKLYEVFELTSTVRVEGFFVHQLALGQLAPFAAYELYQNPTPTSLGHLVTSGQTSGTGFLTGRIIDSYVETRIDISVPAFVLGPGRYAFNICNFGGGATGSTTGLNGVGPTAGDNFSYYLNLMNNSLETRNRSYSMGVVGQPVPEPASLTVLAIGAIALLRRRAT